MTRLRWFCAGVLFIVAITAAAGAIFLREAHGFSAREQPSAVERLVARWARSAALPRDARNRKNPVLNTPQVLVDAREHWADHCALCHANDGSGETQLGKQMYPPAPDMRDAATQSLSDGELFFIIENGIRMTGMPAWGGPGVNEEDSWKLVDFIRHLPRLTVDEKNAMEKLNPKSPQERMEEEQEEKFLRGETSSEPTSGHHHH
jgi:mono/diheme cytochrome c family protein